MRVQQAIKTNRSVREFTDQPVSREDMTAIVNGRLAGSAKNKQPWHFVVVTGARLLAALSVRAVVRHLAGAAFAVVLVVDDLLMPRTLTTPFDRGGKPEHDAGRVGTGHRLVHGDDSRADAARQACHIPEDKDVPWRSVRLPAPGRRSAQPPAASWRQAAS